MLKTLLGYTLDLILQYLNIVSKISYKILFFKHLNDKIVLFNV